MLKSSRPEDHLLDPLCMVVNSPAITPYLTRTWVRKDGLVEEELWKAAKLSVEEFAKKVAEGTLPKEFYSNYMVYDTFWKSKQLHLLNLRGIELRFDPIPKLIPDEPDKDAFSLGDEELFVYFFKKQPAVFSSEPTYKDEAELIAEAKEVLAEFEMELPKDLPFWQIVGLITPLAR